MRVCHAQARTKGTEIGPGSVFWAYLRRHGYPKFRLDEALEHFHGLPQLKLLCKGKDEMYGTSARKSQRSSACVPRP